ncbi:MAG: phosphoglucosamine mutase [Acidobacteria bacterium]|nr:phosphoglucosamine mutase [Acidobacteriota bacterium]MCL5289090.1 phosphoglucosamine mutase [Acidobacteriota bacterium]
MAKHLFGTDGVRGIPGEYPLDDATIYGVGRALGDYLRTTGAEKRVLLGMDTRESGMLIIGKLARGLADAGSLPVFAGVITTPGVACLVRERAFAAGMVVSASHNPWHDNGIKLISSSGMKFPDAIEARIEKEILVHRESVPSKHAKAVALSAERGLDLAYLAFLRSRAVRGASLENLRVVLDCANGAASELAPSLFRSLGAEVIGIHDRPDGRNINAGCGALHPEAMQKKVVDVGAQLGVAFDGDADRAMFSTAAGKLVNGDGILLALGRYFKSNGTLKGPAIVGTTMANLGLERALAREGLKLARVPVGDRYVLEEMIRVGSNLGGEQSGHIILLDDSTTGDGMLTALKIACLVNLRGPLEKLVEGLKIFPQTIVNVKVSQKPPLESLPEVSRLLAEAERALGDAGRIVLRYSGTEPLARVMVEAETQADVDRWSQAIASALRSAIGAA